MIALNIKGKIIKLREANSEENPYGLELGQECLLVTPRSQPVREINTLDPITIQNLFYTTNHVKRMKRKATD